MDNSSSARFRIYFQFAPQHYCPLCHIHYSEMFLCRLLAIFLWIKAAAIICDAENQPLILGGELNSDIRGIGMLSNIMNCFLEYPIRVDRSLIGQFRNDIRYLKMALESCLAAIFFNVPIH